MNNYLETGIAVVLIFFVFSTVTYVIQELIAVNLKFRGKMLKQSLQQLMGIVSSELLKHPQLNKLKENADKLPSYIPATNFAMATIDIIAEKSGARTNDLFADFKNGLTALKNQQANTLIKDGLPKLLETLANSSKDINELQANVEKWFNEYMDRVSGWYKNKYRWVTRIIAICIALAFNLNMVRIIKTIHNDPILKASLVSSAEKLVDQPDVVKDYYLSKVDVHFNEIDKKYDSILKDTATKKINVDSLKNERDSEKYKVLTKYNEEQYYFASSMIKNISSDKLIFGWTKNPFKVLDERTNLRRNMYCYEYLVSFLGLMIGAIAISMGAPFWFEVMMKLVNVRRAGLKPKGDSLAK
ncbi:hypothetical protein EZ428_01245 [Pedobacter frigiditerrae]|uniref:Uncharacterized protein n=1 Tax=Pedobacter frigiditerrae TaxID=2530452 RepID=A0A4V2MJ93_9SPHI|nr:hypothetical protein [Pedobacter frigiditerrae]TCC93426.1 hypothetical protein EZ428_01245 [Pedobacter frigiditerrae]